MSVLINHKLLKVPLNRCVFFPILFFLRQPLVKSIIDMKLVTDVQFCQVLAERLNVSYIDLDNTELMPDIVKKIPEATARKYNVIAVSKIGKRMTVATNDPINFYIFEDLRVITGCSITAVRRSCSVHFYVLRSRLPGLSGHRSLMNWQWDLVLK